MIVAKRQRLTAQAVAYPGGVCKAWELDQKNNATPEGWRKFDISLRKRHGLFLAALEKVNLIR